MWRTDSCKTSGGVIGISVVATVLTVLMTATSIPLGSVAQTDLRWSSEDMVGEEDAKAFTIEDTSMLFQTSGTDSAFKFNRRLAQGPLEAKLLPFEELEDVRLPDYASILGEGGKPSPTDSIDPEPTDAPFLPNDVLVYNDATNSERNVDLAKASNGDLYATYDHDIGTGLRDVYVSKSTDGGLTWAKRDIAVDVAEDEYCPSIAIDYSPALGSEMMYTFYNAPELEFGWSQDGDTWTLEDWGGGLTFWSKVSCPYVAIQGDLIAIVGKYYDNTNLVDAFYILYTLDSFQTAPTGYYFLFWPDTWAAQTRVTIIDNDEVFAAFDFNDRSDPNPSNWWHDTMFLYGTLAGSGNPADDDWTIGWATGGTNPDYTSPTIEAFGSHVVFAMEYSDPLGLPTATNVILCAWTDAPSPQPSSWTGCDNGAYFVALDDTNTYDQKYPTIYREENMVHLAWLNGTDINYRFSPDGSVNWITPPMKVNDPGSSTAINAWHSPDILYREGKAGVAWHDSRGSDNVYFQTFATDLWYEIQTNVSAPGIEVREVGDSWHRSPHYYLWGDGSSHDIEAMGIYEIPADTRHVFNQWDDGSTANPTTVTVSSSDFNITAMYDTFFWLDILAPGGTTNPGPSWQPAFSYVTIEAFPPAAPAGGQYLFLGWTGDILDSRNPCPNCVYMDGPKTIIANFMLQWNVTMHSDPIGLVIQIDGINHTTPYVTWFNDSQMYTINAPSPQGGGPTMRYAWDHWSDAGMQSHDVSVTAPWVNFTAYFNTEYSLVIDTNPAGLQVRINGFDYAAPYTFWCPELSTPWLEALHPQYPGPKGERYAWKEWSNGGTRLHQHQCVGADIIIANYTFQRAVNITTAPPGFNVIVDGQTYATPKMFWWNDTSGHILEAFSSIPVGANNRYNFTGWTDGGARNHTYWANTSDDTVTAYYDFQHKITIVANYPGLTINLDGSPVALPYVYWCTEGTMLFVEAPSALVFGDTRYIFISWSDGGAQAHNIVCDAPATITVNYEKEYRIYLNSTIDGNPTTLEVIAGAVTYPTPAQVWWPADTMMPLDTNEFQPGIDPVSRSRFRFLNWDDSVFKSRTVIVSSPGPVYVANFGTQHKLTFLDPHGTPMTVPAGWPVSDGIYFDSGTVVDIQADDSAPDTVDHRWRFDSWSSSDSGGYSGTNNPATITMNNPITQTVEWFDQYLLSMVSSYGTPSAIGWYEQQSPTEFWYDVGEAAFFWVESQVLISQSEKAVFDSWVGGFNGTVMNNPLVITAEWHLEFLVTILSDYGTAPPSAWVVEYGSYGLTIDEYESDGDSRHYFTGWTSPDTANGSYQGPDRQVNLIVTGSITETASWETQFLLTIITEYGTPEASNWDDQHNATAFWYSEGDVAVFWVGEEVFTSTEEDIKAVFEYWSGGANGTSMNSAITVTAAWHLEYLVTVESEFGTAPPDAWVRDGQTCQISINETVGDPANENIRHVFTSWWTDDTDFGGYEGTERERVLTVTGPILETALWTTQYRLRITSTYGSEPEPLGDPTGEGWYDSGSTATVTVRKSVEKDDHIYRFKEWKGGVVQPDQTTTTVLMDGPKDLSVEWSREAKFSIMDLWWVFIVIIIVVVIVGAMLLKRRSGKKEEGISEEETLVEETGSVEESEEAEREM